MFKFISIRRSKNHRKPVVRFHRTALMAEMTAKHHAGLWKEIPKEQPRKNIGSGEDYAHN
jgi:hypothetical protein